MRVVEVRRYWNAVIWLQSKAKQGVINDNHFTHWEAFYDPKVFDEQHFLWVVIC